MKSDRLEDGGFNLKYGNKPRPRAVFSDVQNLFATDKTPKYPPRALKNFAQNPLESPLEAPRGIWPNTRQENPKAQKFLDPRPNARVR